jgi:hypothetical protein
VVSDGDGESIKDGSDEWEILSAVNGDHGGLSLLSVKSGEDIQKGDRWL